MGSLHRYRMAFHGMHGRPGFGHPGAYGGYPAPGAFASQYAAPTSNLRQENADLQAQMHAMRMMHAQEVTELKQLLANSGGDSKIPPGFEFGQRAFQCVQEPPGVSYRNLPKWDTKREGSTGPNYLEIVIADAICQGPLATFI